MPVNEQIKVSFIGDADPLEKSVSKATGALVKMQTATGRADQALLNLSRVAQDAPYGFIGIANNLNPLLESFQRLTVETGSTKGALTALVGSLSGAGGLGLALGVVSSLAVVFGDKLFDSKKATDDQKEAIDALNRSLEESKGKFDNLVESLQNLQAVGNINLKINNLSPVLGLQAQQVDVATKRFAANSDLTETQNEIDKLTNSINDLKIKIFEESKVPFIAKLNDPTAEYQRQIDEATAKLPILEKAKRDHYKTLNAIEGEQTLTNAQIRLQTKEDNDKAAAEAKTQREKEERERDAAYKKALAEYEKFLEAQKKLRQDFVNAINAAAANPDYSIVPKERSSTTTEDYRQSGRDLEERNNPDTLGFLPKNPNDVAKADAYVQKWIAFQDKLRDFHDDMQQMLQSFAENTAYNIGDAIGAAFSGGDLQGALQGVFGSVGQLLQDMGKLLIQTAIKVEVFKEAFKSIIANPALALSLGIGLIAVGGIIKNTVQPRPFAQGGIVSGPTFGLMGEYSGAKNNPEVVAPLNKLKDMLGDTGGQVVIINSRLRGKDISLQAARQSKSRRRTA